MLPERNCNNCKKQDEWGCYTDTQKPLKFDGQLVSRCPLIPLRDNPRFYIEVTALYSAREKHLYAESGSYYDQPHVYNRLMSEMDSIVSDAIEQKHAREEQDRKDLDTINKMMQNSKS